MITSYMDESVDTDQKGVFAVGGFLGRGVPICDLQRADGVSERMRVRTHKASRFLWTGTCGSNTTDGGNGR
jgi:hypothetical protein